MWYDGSMRKKKSTGETLPKRLVYQIYWGDITNGLGVFGMHRHVLDNLETDEESDGTGVNMDDWFYPVTEPEKILAWSELMASVGYGEDFDAILAADPEITDKETVHAMHNLVKLHGHHLLHNHAEKLVKVTRGETSSKFIQILVDANYDPADETYDS